MKGLSLDNYDRMNQMKDRSESLRSAREEERKQIADEKLYDHFRQNCPDIRKVRSGKTEFILHFTVIYCTVMLCMKGSLDRIYVIYYLYIYLFLDGI